jgi:eukaryotic-like serine/threonine-protein kinase
MSETLFGPFALGERLSVGGTSEVFVAHDTRRANAHGLVRVIVKRLLPQLRDNPELRAIYAREGALQALVLHPAVVGVFEAAVAADGEPYLVTEFVDGIDCDRLVRLLRRSGRPLETSISVYIATEILGALGAVHSATDAEGKPLTIVHRDVTPSNIYLAKSGAVKLGDFGLAFSQAHSAHLREHDATLKGKFAYLAPEQVSGERATHHADLFSLAAVLAELLLGEPLFAGASQLAVLLSIRDGLSGKVERLQSSVPPGLLAALKRGLAVRAADRFENAAAFAAALAPFAPNAAADRHDLATQVALAAAATVHSAPPQAEWLTAARDASRRRGTRNVTGYPAPLPREESETSPSEIALTRTEVVTNITAAHRPAPGQERSPATAAPDRTRAHAEEPHSRAMRMDSEHPATARFGGHPSFAVTARGDRLGPLTYAELVEAIAIGRISRGDRVNYLGAGNALVEEIDELERFLPLITAVTVEMAGIGAPDFQDELTPEHTLEMLGRILRGRETGILFAENADVISGATGTPPNDSASTDAAASALTRGRKDLYFEDGRLMHATSGDASELLGTYLVRRGLLDREELSVALAVLPRFGGRMGDTLIGLGLVGPVEVFRAIRDQGRDRVADLFRWSSGKLAFYKGAAAPRIEFPLRLDLPGLMLAGLDAQLASDNLVASHRELLERPLAKPIGSLDDGYQWPDAIRATLSATTHCANLRELLQWAAAAKTYTHGDVVRALRVLVVCRKVQFADEKT